MALNAYLKLRGQVQGDILGSVVRAGHAGKIEVVAVEHALSSQREAASGQATGRPRHSEITITKEIDRSTVRLYSALVNNESLVEWKLEFLRPGSGGQDEQHYTVELFNAIVSAIAFRMPDTREPELRTRESFETVKFVYERIRWTWNDGGLAFEDAWTSPNA